MDSLTPKQQRFIVEYLVDKNGKAAAIRAGYSPNAAAQQAYELLRNPKVKDAIEGENQASLDRVRVTRDRIIEGLLKEAEDGDNSGGERIRAWELLGKVEGMFVERKEVKHSHEHDFFASIDLTEPAVIDGGELTALPDLTDPDPGEG